MKPDHKTPIQILVKIRGKSPGRAAIHLYDPHSSVPGSSDCGASVCSIRVSPGWLTDGGLPMWEVRPGTLADVTCLKCRRWMDEWDAPSKHLSQRALRELEQWEQWTGQPHPGRWAR